MREKEKEIELKKEAIFQTEEKIGSQSSNAKSERQREFDNNQRSEPVGSRLGLHYLEIIFNLFRIGEDNL